jgi:multiple sugar transport system permease protein
MRGKIGKKTGDVLTYLAVAVVVICVLFPVYWMVATSLKGGADIRAMPPVWIFRPTLDNYETAFMRRDFGVFFLNSVIVSLSSTFISVMLGSMAGYALAKYNIRYKSNVSFWIISTRMFPPIAAIIPIFMLYKTVGLLNTKVGLIILYGAFNLPFVVWVMKGFFQEIPSELADAAQVDGCTPWGTYFKIILPLSAPGLVATTIFCMLFAWNEFLFAFILMRAENQTLPIAVMGFITNRGVLWGEITAAATIIMTPMIIFTFFVQRYLLRGLTLGAVKG